MATYLIDTNHIGRVIDAHHPLRARLLGAIARGDSFSIVVPLITEAIAGFSILPRAVQNWGEWRLLRPALALLPLDEADAEAAAALQVLLRRAGHQLTTVDALAAAAALRYGLTLLTTDRDFAAIQGISLENWLAGA